MRPCRRWPRARRCPCTWTSTASAGTRRRPRLRSITAAAKHCRMPPNTAAQTPRSRSRPHADEQTLNLVISDTGRGFDRATIGIGLTNMTDRLSAIGGQLVIDTAPGRGTRITATVDAPPRPVVDTGRAGHFALGGVHTTVNRVAHTVAKQVPPQQDGTTSSKISGWQDVQRAGARMSITESPMSSTSIPEGSGSSPRLKLAPNDFGDHTRPSCRPAP